MWASQVEVLLALQILNVDAYIFMPDRAICRGTKPKVAVKLVGEH